MEDTVFKILTENRIYFCEEEGKPITTSSRVMMKCFDVFIIEEGWLFYRLKDDCKERGYLDEDECLIGPCDDYDKMICMAKLFEGDLRVKYLESPSWIEEDDFHNNRKRGTLVNLIDEICKIDQAGRDSEGNIRSSEGSEGSRSHNSNGSKGSHNFISSDSTSNSDHSTEYDHYGNGLDNSGEKEESNFALGYSSDENSEESDGSEGSDGAEGSEGSDGAEGSDGLEGLEGSEGSEGLEGLEGSEELENLPGSEELENLPELEELENLPELEENGYDADKNEYETL